MNPITPDTVGESAAEIRRVDYPEQLDIEALPVETTEADNIDTSSGYIFDEIMPGDSQPMPEAKPPKFSAVRVTEVSDNILFGSAILGPSNPPFILIPGHRDRVRVTIQVINPAGGHPVFLGEGTDISAGFSAWQVTSDRPLVFATRAAIWAATGTGGAAVTVQWAIELVAEGCGCQ
jgi:hypothetical protein